jgi:sugar phosphate isomerase/epimerase
MPAPISVQLYSLREQMKDGKHAEIIRKLAATGYKGVECAGYYGLQPKELRKLVTDNGMVVSSNHAPLPNAQTLQQCIDNHKDLGTTYAVCPWLPREEYASVDAIKKVADKFNAVLEPLAKAGITLLMHNHDWEFSRVDGKLAVEHLLAHCPKLQLEIDTYWAANFGAEVPAKMVAQFKDRTPLLHLKDGPFEHKKPMVACGAGKQDFAAIIAAADPKVLKWAVVELDECGTDMWTAIADSYAYLVGKGLATGSKPANSAAKK